MQKKKETKTERETKKIENKKISEEEFEKKVLELVQQDLTSEKIGENLRKQGIHPKEHGKKISKILKEKNMYTNPDLKNIEEKLNKIIKHYEKNKQDKRAVREKDRIYAKLRKLRNYFKIPLRKK